MKTRQALCVGALLTAFGCVEPDPPSGLDDSGPWTGSPPSGCPEYTGVDRVGAAFVWESTDTYFELTGERLRHTTTPRPDGSGVVGAVGVFHLGELESPDHDPSTWVGSSDYHCGSRGLRLRSTYREVTSTLDGVSTTTSVRTTYTREPLVIPLGLSAGDTWDAVAEGTRVRTDAAGQETESPVSSSMTYTAFEADDVTVPAGTFQVLEIRSSDGDVHFVTPEIGPVLVSDHLHLVDWSP
jgi:hypothetical protein